MKRWIEEQMQKKKGQLRANIVGLSKEERRWYGAVNEWNDYRGDSVKNKERKIQ